MKNKTIGYIGLGLIGGSIAKSIKKYKSNYIQLVYDPSEHTRSLAKKEQIADFTYDHISQDFSKCDYLFLCAPVQENILNLNILKDILPKKCIITDVSSVKNELHEAINKLGLSSQFIGGHPMAGSERSGYANSKVSLLENTFYVLTPGAGSTRDALEDYIDLIKDLHGIPFVLSHEYHDYATAAVSHLPHIIAYTLVDLVQSHDDENQVMKTIAAGGFKDITRIASSSPELWSQICFSNKGNIITLLKDYIASLEKVYSQLNNGQKEELTQYFKNAGQYRDSIPGKVSGPLVRQNFITIEIPDIPGSLAKITALLAQKNISIKNIGITHNRELAEGSLSLEFYNTDSLELSLALLEKEGYSCIKRENEKGTS